MIRGDYLCLFLSFFFIALFYLLDLYLIVTIKQLLHIIKNEIYLYL